MPALERLRWNLALTVGERQKEEGWGQSQGEVEEKVKEGPLTLTASLSSLPLASSEPSLALGHCAHLWIQPPDFGEI